MRDAWMLAALVGCYGPIPPAGVPCDPAASHCPAGQQCALGAGGYTCGGDGLAGDASGDVAVHPDVADPHGDDDGDGIENALDNCPEDANPGQENEDGDPYGDVCDPCPGLPSLVEADGDGDGVGDRCDPHPSTPGDKRFLFEAFHGGVPSGGGWDPFGSWVKNGDGVSIDNASHANITIAGPAGMHLSVSTLVTMSNKNGPNPHLAGAVLNKQASQETGIACDLTLEGATTELGLVNANNGGGSVFQEVPYAWSMGSAYVTTITQTGTDYTCVIETLDGGNRMAVTGTNAVVNADHEAGIIIANASGRFEWLFVVASP